MAAVQKDESFHERLSCCAGLLPGLQDDSTAHAMAGENDVGDSQFIDYREYCFGEC